MVMPRDVPGNAEEEEEGRYTTIDLPSILSSLITKSTNQDTKQPLNERERSSLTLCDSPPLRPSTAAGRHTAPASLTRTEQEDTK